MPMVSKGTEGLIHSVRIETLGGFSIRIGDQIVSDAQNRSRKLWNLLAYLMAFRNRFVTQSELMEILWPEEDSGNPVSALKTLVSRARDALAPLAKGETPMPQLLISQQGSYLWNKELNYSVDAEEFEALCKKAGNGVGAHAPETRLELYREAVALYKGDFLPKLSEQMWVAALSAHYQAMYLEAVKGLAALLEEREAFGEIAEICSRAIQIDPYDEQLHTLMIKALVGQGKNSAALSHYETATDMLYRNLGISPSKELREAYLEIMKERKNLETDLGLIQDSLKEDAQPGAFLCDFGFFKEAYNLEVRRAARQGSCAHIGLLTLTDSKGAVPPLDVLNKAMSQLLFTLKASLRKGDVISQYSGAQFLIMLPNANYEDSLMVMGRIMNAFYKQNRKMLLTLHYKFKPIQLMDIDHMKP